MKAFLATLLMAAASARLNEPSLDESASHFIEGNLPDVTLPDIHTDKDTVTIDLTGMVMSGLTYDTATITVDAGKVTTSVAGVSASLSFSIKAREDIWPHPSLSDTGTASLKNTKMVISVAVDGSSKISVQSADIELGDINLNLDHHKHVAWLTDKLVGAFKSHLGKSISDAIVAKAQNIDLLSLAQGALLGRTMSLPDQHESITGGGELDLTSLNLDHLGVTDIKLSTRANQLEVAIEGATANGSGNYAYKEFILHNSGSMDITVGPSKATVTLDIAPNSDLDSVMVGDPTVLALGDLDIQLTGSAVAKVVQVVADLAKPLIKRELETNFKSVISKLLPGGADPASRTVVAPRNNDKVILNDKDMQQIPLALK